MIHRFVDLFPEEELDPIIIYLTRRHTGGTSRFVTLGGGGATPDRLDLTQTTPGSALLSQPELSPDGTEYVYVWKDNDASIGPTQIRRGEVTDTVALVAIATDPSAGGTPFGTADILGWSPDGQQVYYRGENNGTDRDTEVRVVNRDGTGNTLLWSSTTLETFEWGRRARLSPDGTQIALWVDESADGGLWVMDSDGTNMTRIYTAATPGFPMDFYGWSPDGAWLLLMDTSGGHVYIRKCDSTGSTVVTLHDRLVGTDPAIALAVGPVWLSDSSGVAARWDLGGAEPQHEIGVLSADGSETWTPLSPQRKAWETMTGIVLHYGPCVFGNRIYWVEGVGDGGEKLVSALYDGSDYRVDHDMDTDATEDDYSFNGFWRTAV